MPSAGIGRNVVSITQPTYSTTDTTQTTINEPHCQQCGNTDWDALGQNSYSQGYTVCCNQRVIWPT